MHQFSPRPARRAVVASAAGVAALLAVAGCTSKGTVVSVGDAPSASSEPSASATPPAPAPRLVLPKSPVAFDKPLHISVRHATLTAVTVQLHPDTNTSPSPSATPSATSPATSPATEPTTPRTLAGRVGANGAWTSTTPPTPGATYDVAATVTTAAGEQRTLTRSVTVAEVPAAERLTLTMQPRDGSTVGVGQPVIIRFDQPVSPDDRAAIERHATVLTNSPVTGSWHWISSQELHFRPKAYWPAHSHVQVRLDLGGVRASDSRWGARSYVENFTIGAKRVSTVDGDKHTLTVRVDGKKVATWPTSLGKPEFATRTGTYVVLDKVPTMQMTSCSVHISCKKGTPNYYDLTVLWDVRLTWSGTFVHAAPWSASNQGVANVSHGCINLTTDRGEQFYKASLLGDVVVVKHTGRTAADLVAKHDPGMADWNSSWADYVAGSALGHAVKTGKLPAS